MSCDVSTESLSALVDGELDTGASAAIREHAATCPTCAARLEALRAGKHAVGRLPASVPLQAAARARIDAALDAADRRAARRRRAFVIAACGAALAAASSLAWLLSPEPASYAVDLIDDYTRSVPAELPGEVVSGDRDTVRTFFDGRVPFDPLVPDLPDAQLLGGRVCVVRGRATQMLFYLRARTTLALFVVDHPDAAPLGCVVEHGQAACCRHAGGRRLMLVGPLPAGELDRLVHAATL